MIEEDKKQDKDKNKKKQKEKQEQEKQEEELKIIREIKPELKEIESEEGQEIDEFIPTDSFEAAVAPVLQKTNLEQTVEDVEVPKDEDEKDKEKKGAVRYVEHQDPGYFIGGEDEEEKREEERAERVMKVTMHDVEKIHHPEPRHFRERPIEFIDDLHRLEGKAGEIMKYEKAGPEKPGTDLPFAKQETDIERRVKKYKRKL